jgi:hypothetical protein
VISRCVGLIVLTIEVTDRVHTSQKSKCTQQKIDEHKKHYMSEIIFNNLISSEPLNFDGSHKTTKSYIIFDDRYITTNNKSSEIIANSKSSSHLLRAQRECESRPSKSSFAEYICTGVRAIRFLGSVLATAHSICSTSATSSTSGSSSSASFE